MKTTIIILSALAIITGISYFIFSSSHVLTIQIRAFDDLPQEEIQSVFEKIKKNYPNTILLTSAKLPVNSYYHARNRYKADTIMHWLSEQTPKYCITIGITSKDISTSKDSIADWGVMGLGMRPGNACVVSTYRLNKQNLLDQLYKVSVHELGHTFGLVHCNDKTCYMRDAEGHNTTDEETGFCPKCRKKLENKGWIFSN